MAIIDFHSHILPGIDDGSKNVETTLGMLEESGKQGIEYMVATPHFYAECDRVDDFLKRRAEAYELVKQQKINKAPHIILGVEVAYFEGISGAKRLSEFTIGESNALLLELPFRKWEPHVIDEIRMISEERNFKIILAHLDRYFSIADNKRQINKLLDLPVIVQMNAGSLLDWKRRGKVIRYFNRNRAHLLGSDCHGIHHRAQNLRSARQIIQKKTGAEVLERIDALGGEILFPNNRR